MRRLVGFDLNGWNDFAVRNWLEEPGQEAVEGKEQVIHGGIGGVIVRVSESTHVGGVQALKSPHGRGPGWGQVGQAENRQLLSELLESPGNYKPEIASALTALAEIRGVTSVLAIPDTSEVTEADQEHFIEILRLRRVRRKLLVWRPVLATLAALERKELDTAKVVGVIGHCGKGLTSQRLIMRYDRVRAPERRKTGQLHLSAFGLDHLLKKAREELRMYSEDPSRADHTVSSEIAWKLALGYSVGPEPMRRANGTWEVVTPPNSLALARCSIPTEIIAHLDDCDVVLVETPTTGQRRQALKGALGAALGKSMIFLEQEDVARGALLAARRMESNLPVYFDFLPQISTIVQDAEGAKNYDLIPADEVLPAGKVYKSSRPARLGLVAGMTEVKVHLKKETVESPRRAVVGITSPPLTNLPVMLYVEQTPGLGRATLTLTSEGFPGPLIVDWDKAEILEESWDEIIDSQKPSRPTVPNRLILPCGLENWEDQDRGEGLISMLKHNLSAPAIDWKQLADKMSARPYGKYSVSSDGGMPDGLSQEAMELLEEVIRRAEEDIRSRLDRTGGSTENHSLRLLTWMFQRCPDWLVEPMIDSLNANVRQHVFLPNHQSMTLLYQGLGRTARRSEHQKRIFQHLLRVEPEKWNKNQLACAAFLLSRTDSAPHVLERKDVDFIADIVVKKMLEAIGTDYTTRFSYTPYLLVGLLRWRLKKPWALVAGKEPVAAAMLDATRRVIADMSHVLHRPPHLRRHHVVLRQICDELEGQGTNPDILIDLESLAK